MIQARASKIDMTNTRYAQSRYMYRAGECALQSSNLPDIYPATQLAAGTEAPAVHMQYPKYRLLLTNPWLIALGCPGL